MMMHTLLQSDRRHYRHCGHRLPRLGCKAQITPRRSVFLDLQRTRAIPGVRTKPYLIAEVNRLEDQPKTGEDDLEGLANEVEKYMKDVIRLSNRLDGKPEMEVEGLRKKLFPTPFSFLVGGTFEGRQWSWRYGGEVEERERDFEE